MRASTAAPRLLGALWLASAGCGTGPLDVWLPLPDASSDEGSFLVGFPERSSARVYVADTDQTDDFYLELPERSPEDGPIEVGFFEHLVDERKLQPGWQSAPVAGRASSALAEGDAPLLGEPTRTFSADLLGTPASWRETEGLSTLVSGFEVAVPELGCPDLYPPNSNVTAPIDVAWASALSDELTLVYDGLHNLHIFSSVERELRDAVPAHPYTAATYAEGWAYLGDLTGQVWRGLADPETVIDVPRPLGERLPNSVLALAAGGPQDIFALITGGEVFHFDGDTWTSLGQASDARTRMRWIGPQRALLFVDVPNVVYVLTPEGLQVETVAETGILTGTYSEQLGVVVGTSDGELLHEVDEGWRKLGDARFGWWVLDVVPYGQGVAQLLASGTVSGHQDGIGDCGDQYILHIITRGWLVPQSTGLLVVAKKADVDITDFVVLEPL